MESELVRQAEILFGEPMTRFLTKRPETVGAIAQAGVMNRVLRLLGLKEPASV